MEILTVMSAIQCGISCPCGQCNKQAWMITFLTKKILRVHLNSPMSGLKCTFSTSIRIPNTSSFAVENLQSPFNDLSLSPAQTLRISCFDVCLWVCWQRCYEMALWDLSCHWPLLLQPLCPCQLSGVSGHQGEQNHDWSLANWIKALCALDWQTAVNTLEQ